MQASTLYPKRGDGSAVPSTRCATQRRLIVVHGMMRSGNHAIIKWILGHAELPFFNALLGPGRPLDGRLRKPSPIDFVDWRQQEVPLNRLGPGPEDQLLVSLEDFEPGFVPFYNVPVETLHILIVRDPYNTFASRIRMIRQETNDLGIAERLMPHLVDLWIRYAQEFLGVTENLENKFCINYNLWFESRAYRQGLSAQLGFPFSDVNFSIVTGHGQGSSFDGRRFHGHNTQMNVLNRFEQLSSEEQQIHLQFVCREQVHALSAKLWKPAGRFRPPVAGG